MGLLPIEISSVRPRGHRLWRLGNRKPSATLHVIVLTQARVHPQACAYLAKKRAEVRVEQGGISCLNDTLVRVACRPLRPPVVASA